MHGGHTGHPPRISGLKSLKPWALASPVHLQVCSELYLIPLGESWRVPVTPMSCRSGALLSHVNPFTPDQAMRRPFLRYENLHIRRAKRGLSGFPVCESNGNQHIHRILLGCCLSDVWGVNKAGGKQLSHAWNDCIWRKRGLLSRQRSHTPGPPSAPIAHPSLSAPAPLLARLWVLDREPGPL